MLYSECAVGWGWIEVARTISTHGLQLLAIRCYSLLLAPSTNRTCFKHEFQARLLPRSPVDPLQDQLLLSDSRLMEACSSLCRIQFRLPKISETPPIDEDSLDG